MFAAKEVFDVWKLSGKTQILNLVMPKQLLFSLSQINALSICVVCVF